MRLVFTKPDLDTTLAAFLLGVSNQDELVHARTGASPADLADAGVVCVEAGGSGQVRLNNFDHHDTDRPLPPACRQALERRPDVSPAVRRLVDYVAAVDVGKLPGGTLAPARPENARNAGRPRPRGTEHSGSATSSGLSLAALHSGMRLCIRDPVTQLRQGLAMLATVLAEGIDPLGPMPEREEWREWAAVKRLQREALRGVLVMAELFTTSRGVPAGFLETDLVGALGALYGLGCRIAVGFAPEFGDPPIRKFTVAGNGLRVDHLLAHLSALESGWGGPAHGTIIASPRAGSCLSAVVVKRIVRDHA